jgi:hypothetical protein
MTMRNDTKKSLDDLLGGIVWGTAVAMPLYLMMLHEFVHWRSIWQRVMEVIQHVVTLSV